MLADTALQAGLLRGQGYDDAGLNALGAGLVRYSLQDAFNTSAAFMQVAWISISAFGIGRYSILTHTSRFTTEEAALLEATVPGLGRIDARRLLDLGECRDAVSGARLSAAGTVNDNVYYLLSGAAEVDSPSTLSARPDARTFVGDMGLVTGGPATASVTVVAPGRLLVLAVEHLARLRTRNPRGPATREDGAVRSPGRQAARHESRSRRLTPRRTRLGVPSQEVVHPG